MNRWSLKNWISNVFAAGYDAAEYGRTHKQLGYGRTTPKDEDSVIGKWDRQRLRMECINLRRNDAIVSGVVERFADNVVGSGIMPQARTSDPKWNDEAELYWYEWSKIADVRHRVDMREIQRLIVQQRLLSGDVGFILTSSGQLQPIESERIATPAKLEEESSIVEGVRLNRYGQIDGAYIFERSKDGAIDTAKGNYEFIPGANFIFCSAPQRFDQVRGIPTLAPVINSLRHMHAIQDAIQIKAKMDAMNAWAIKRDGSNGPGNFGPRNGGSTSVDNVQYERFEGGRTHYLRPGESVESLSSNTPNAEYFEFTRLSLRIIGSALCLPYEFLLLDFSQGNFSSSRAALLQTYRTFSGWQEWTSKINQRIWNWRIAKAIKEKQIRPAPISNGVSEWYKVEWSFPEFGWVDPQAEATTAQIEYNMGVNTLSAITRKKGRDAEDVLREKGNDIATAIRVADQINKEHGTSITWRDLIASTMPGQQAATESKPATTVSASTEGKQP